MAEHGQTPRDGNLVATKRGLPVYRVNPSIPPSNGLATRQKRFEVPGGKAALIVDNSTGELKGIGGMGFWWQEEVDASRFVKLFLDGIKQACNLSKAGMQVFELVYHQMREKPGHDKIELSQYFAHDQGLNERTFRRGLRKICSFRRHTTQQAQRLKAGTSQTNSSFGLGKPRRPNEAPSCVRAKRGVQKPQFLQRRQ